ncbi:MAG TPA: aminoglycoside phosphotransferase family protein [Myxococcota bacterium]|nr:aminoglycoside phosphotransferase family protein [Myxococcota bacterium]
MTEIPESLDTLTPEWLTAAVQGVAPGARASAVEIVDAHSGTTGRARLAVAWERGELPSALFVKLPPTDSLQRAMAVETGMGAREARFCRELAREVPVRVPRPIASFWSEDRRAYLMLGEDLEAAGCTFPSFESGADLAVVRGAVEGLARLHAAFWESPRFEAGGDLDWIEPPMHHEMGPRLVAAGVEAFGAEQPEAFHEMAPIYTQHGAAVAGVLAAGPQTLLHGDPHLGNLFLDGGAVGFLDWACVSRGPGLRDVAYHLCCSVETALRRAEEEKLLRRYLEVLAESGAPAPGFDEAFAAYRRFVAAGWIAGVATYAVGARMQSLEVGRRAVARANAAIADLGTPELIRAELGLDA